MEIWAEHKTKVLAQDAWWIWSLTKTWVYLATEVTATLGSGCEHSKCIPHPVHLPGREERRNLWCNYSVCPHLQPGDIRTNKWPLISLPLSWWRWIKGTEWGRYHPAFPDTTVPAPGRFFLLIIYCLNSVAGNKEDLSLWISEISNDAGWAKLMHFSSLRSELSTVA